MTNGFQICLGVRSRVFQLMIGNSTFTMSRRHEGGQSGIMTITIGAWVIDEVWLNGDNAQVTDDSKVIRNLWMIVGVLRDGDHLKVIENLWIVVGCWLWWEIRSYDVVFGVTSTFEMLMEYSRYIYGKEYCQSSIFPPPCFGCFTLLWFCTRPPLPTQFTAKSIPLFCYTHTHRNQKTKDFISLNFTLTLFRAIGFGEFLHLNKRVNLV